MVADIKQVQTQTDLIPGEAMACQFVLGDIKRFQDLLKLYKMAGVVVNIMIQERDFDEISNELKEACFIRMPDNRFLHASKVNLEQYHDAKVKITQKIMESRAKAQVDQLAKPVVDKPKEVIPNDIKSNGTDASPK